MHIQEIYSRYLGDFGRYQVLVLILISIVRLPTSIHNMGYVYFARTPEHSCSFKQNTHLNFTYEQWKTLSVPRNKKTSEWSQCHLYIWNKNVTNMTSDDVNSTLMMLESDAGYGDDLKYRCEHWNYNTWTDVHSSLVTKVSLFLYYSKANRSGNIHLLCFSTLM